MKIGFRQPALLRERNLLRVPRYRTTTGIRTLVELLLKGVYSATFNVDVNQLTRIRVLNLYKLYSFVETLKSPTASYS